MGCKTGNESPLNLAAISSLEAQGCEFLSGFRGAATKSAGRHLTSGRMHNKMPTEQ